MSKPEITACLKTSRDCSNGVRAVLAKHASEVHASLQGAVALLPMQMFE